jgi:DNA-directed RNA polymerase subunit omega
MSVHLKVDDLLEKIDSKYALVQVAARRARQINDYYHHLGEGMGGAYDSFPPPLIESYSKNYLTLAMEEILANKIRYEYPDMKVVGDA